MIKLKVILMCTFLCINLGGCISPMTRGERLTKELGSEHQIADQMMEDIATTLDNGDADALKSLFSKTALEEATDIDQQIFNLLNFYQGKMKEFEGTLSSSTNTEYGEDIEKSISGEYVLITDEKTYRVAYEYQLIDKENPDKEGLSVLEFVTEETYQLAINSEEGYYQWQYPDSGAGVYIKE